MRVNFELAMKCILVSEGGKVDDKRDPGGRTNEGVTQAEYDDYRKRKGLAAGDVYNMTAADRDDLYFNDYWTPCGGDLLPNGLDLAVFDAAVNSGVGMSTRWLQSALNIPSDGAMGPLTRKAIYNLAAEHDEADIIRHFCSLRLGSLERLSTWPTFGKGWSARVARVQSLALAWDNAPPTPIVAKSPISASPALASALKAAPPSAAVSSASIAPKPKPIAQTTAVDTLQQGNMKAPISPERLVQPAVNPLAVQTGSGVLAIAGAAAHLVHAVSPGLGAMLITGYCFFGAAGAAGVFAAHLAAQHRASSDAALGKRRATTGVV